MERRRKLETAVRSVVETLEDRRLLAVLPAPNPLANGNIDVVPWADQVNATTPTIAYNPQAPNQLVMAYTRRSENNQGDPTIRVFARYSTDGGVTWNDLTGADAIPGPANNLVTDDPFDQVTDATVAFDRLNRFYVLVSSHDDANGAGALVLHTYDFSLGTPLLVSSTEIQRWTDSVDPVIAPTLAVNGNLRQFTDPDTGAVLTDASISATGQGPIYVAWHTNDVAPQGVQQFNPNVIKLVASSDGGATFTPPVIVNDTGYTGGGGAGSAVPKITISQGTADGRVAPGQVNVVWTNFGPGDSDNIRFDRLSGALAVVTGSGTTGPINNASDPGNNQPHQPASTSYTVDLVFNDPRFVSLADLNVSLSLLHPELSHLSISLQAPNGTLIPLLQNRFDEANQVQPPTGNPRGLPAGTSNLGVIFTGNPAVAVPQHTIFDQQAARPLTDPNAVAPYTANYRPPGGTGAAGGLNALNGLTPADLQGTWTLIITDFLEDGDPEDQAVLDWSLSLRSGLVPGTDVTIAAATFAGDAGGINDVESDAVPDSNIGTTPVIASDNTLGSFSPFQGRLYAVWVARVGAAFDDNTDIFMKVSDDGGLTWKGVDGGVAGPWVDRPIVTTEPPRRINDDTVGDGFSEGNRPQFQPQVAVDNTTGAVVVSWYDARHDAARARVATYLAASIDGGMTFSQNFVSKPNAPFDGITRQNVVIGPIPANQSAGNPDREVENFGSRQGLIAVNGIAYPIWAGNENTETDDTNDADAFGARGHLRIIGARTPITAGPRIVSSTMGSVGSALNSFQIEFDRPVDPSTFTPGDIQIIYSSPDGSVQTQIASTAYTVTPIVMVAAGALEFRVDFNSPQTLVGTYSYTVAATISDRIRTAQSMTTVAPVATGTSLTGSNTPFTIIPPVGTGGSATASDNTAVSTVAITGSGAGEFVFDVDVDVSFQHDVPSDLDLTLITPGGLRIPLALNRTGSNAFMSTTFDDSAAASIADGYALSVRPEVPLGSLAGIAADGVWSLEFVDDVANGVGFFLSWNLTVHLGTLGSTTVVTVIPGNEMDQNNDGIKNNFNDSYIVPGSVSGQGTIDTLPLVVTGPRVVSVNGLGLGTGNQTPLTINSAVSSVIVTFDRDMNASTFSAADVLRLIGPNGQVISDPAMFNVAALGDGRSFTVSFPTQTLSGYYTLQLSSQIASAAGHLLDTNQNAGVDRHFGISAFNVPIRFDNAAPAQTAGSVTSRDIVIGDDFRVAGARLSLNITFSNTQDLRGELIAPDGTIVQLFDNVGLGQPGNTQNFTNTLFDFDDGASTPIAESNAPFFGRFRPQFPLGALVNKFADGTWTLRVTNTAGGPAAQIDSWSLTLDKPQPGTGLGEDVADQVGVSFRIHTLSGAASQSHGQWTTAGGAPVDQDDGNFNTGLDGGILDDAGFVSGRVSAIAVDPSDPSGNTVYVGGANGGIWKTTNFLTTSPGGPTWVPLTDFGPDLSVSIGSISVLGRNNDPNQSIVFASTGEGDTLTGGVGFLRSMDGGATWSLQSSLVNVNAAGAPTPYTSRVNEFVGLATYKVVIDPRLTPTGEAIIYAAMSDPNPNVPAPRGGIYRSIDSGDTWQLLRAGQATDIELDLDSAYVDALRNPTGNVEIIYSAFRGEGVFISPNRGQVWNQMTGGLGISYIRQADVPNSPIVPVNAPQDTPNGAKGRIVLAKPRSPVASIFEQQLYQGWLYALVVDADGSFDGLYITKDFGANWTQVQMFYWGGGDVNRTVHPTNDSSREAIPFFDEDGERVASLAVDPTNPNVVYVGAELAPNTPGSQLLRVDITGIDDPHSIFFNDSQPDGGETRATIDVGVEERGDAAAGDARDGGLEGTIPAFPNPRHLPQVNMLRNPLSPNANTTIFVYNVATLTNTGLGAKVTLMDMATAHNVDDFGINENSQSATDNVRFRPLGADETRQILTIRDPLTGESRLVYSDAGAIYTAVDTEGKLNFRINALSRFAHHSFSGTGIGLNDTAFGNRTGNLQLAQVGAGALTPNGAVIYANIQDILTAQAFGSLNGNNQWDDGIGRLLQFIAPPNIFRTEHNFADFGIGNIEVDQTGSGDYYFALSPFDQSTLFRVNSVSKTFGLLQNGNLRDPQWNGFIDFAVNPINGNQIVIGSNVGRVFATDNKAEFWLEIGSPAALGNSRPSAFAYGAPNPNDPTAPTGNFIYAGTVAGQVFVTFTGGGGGATPNDWTNISNGLNGAQIQQIIANPERGSRDAYAVTTTGVFYLADAAAANPTWVNITGNLNAITHSGFGDPLLTETRVAQLSSIQADWRYTIPDSAANPSGPHHPVLYVGGRGGVYRSFDKGQSWQLFPDETVDEAAASGGHLPNLTVSDIDIAVGNINPTTGRPDVSTGSSAMLASTAGRGAFMIRIAPVIVPGSADLDPASDNGIAGDGITSDTTPTFSGRTQQSAFGNIVRVTLLDMTDPNNPLIIGGYNPAVPATDVAANHTDAAGLFTITVNSALTSGNRVIGIRATDDAGVVGPIVTFPLTIDTTAPVVTADNITAVEGSTFNGKVGSFTDVSGGTGATVMINWGDGTAPTAGTIVANGNAFDVRGTHVYAVDGQYTITVTVLDSTGLSGSDTATATVLNRAVSVQGGFIFRAAEDQQSDLQTVATFTDPGGAGNVSDYSVVVNWGDGTSNSTNAQLTITKGTNNVFTIQGRHTYSSQGNRTITVTVTRTGAASAQGTSTAQVVGAPVNGTVNALPNQTEGVSCGCAVTATFTDGGNQNASGYSATINWGDGTSNNALIVFSNGRFEVGFQAGHIWQTPGNYTITTTIRKSGALDEVVTDSIFVGQRNLDRGTPGPTFQAVEAKQSDTQVVGTFRDLGGPENINNFTASINWGDGTAATAGTITLEGGIYVVRGNHLYQTQGNRTIAVTVRHTTNGVAAPNLVIQTPASVAQNPNPAPQNVQINSGSTQRSDIDRITFNLPSVLNVSSLTKSNLVLKRNGFETVSLAKAGFTYTASTRRGNLDLRNLNLAEGDYQLQINAGGRVVVLEFHKLIGDADGNRRVDDADKNIVLDAIRTFDSDGDLNGDGKADTTDRNIQSQNNGDRLNLGSFDLRINGTSRQIPNFSFGTLRDTSPTFAIDLVIRNTGTSRITIPAGMRITSPNNAAHIFAFGIVGSPWGTSGQSITLAAGETRTVRLFARMQPNRQTRANLTFNYRIGTSTTNNAVSVLLQANRPPLG